MAPRDRIGGRVKDRIRQYRREVAHMDDDRGGAAAKAPRKLSREARRVQLIESTIEVMARNGYARTTLTEVARQAGLSHGLVNFHFASKEGLLAETLAYLAEEYRRNWETALARAPASPAARLDAMIRADFEPSICTPTRLSAWCSFWGEAQARPVYQENCGANDDLYNSTLEQLCREITAEGGYPVDPVLIGRGLRVMLEGAWLEMMTMSRPYEREVGLRAIHACVAAFFPKHFDADGLIG